MRGVEVLIVCAVIVATYLPFLILVTGLSAPEERSIALLAGLAARLEARRRRPTQTGDLRPGEGGPKLSRMNRIALSATLLCTLLLGACADDAPDADDEQAQVRRCTQPDAGPDAASPGGIGTSPSGIGTSPSTPAPQGGIIVQKQAVELPYPKSLPGYDPTSPF